MKRKKKVGGEGILFRWDPNGWVQTSMVRSRAVNSDSGSQALVDSFVTTRPDEDVADGKPNWVC